MTHVEQRFNQEYRGFEISARSFEWNGQIRFQPFVKTNLIGRSFPTFQEALKQCEIHIDNEFAQQVEKMLEEVPTEI